MRAFQNSQPPQRRAAAAILALLTGTLLLSACNTTAGAGRDVSATGEAVTDTANKAKQALPSP
jgi:predicted small secreted protein